MLSTQAPLDFYDIPDDSTDCLARVLSIIQGVRSSYYEMMYEFGDRDYADALLTAFHGGKDVKIIADHVQCQGKGPKAVLSYLLAQGLPPANIAITTSLLHAIMHLKLGIADGDTDAGLVIEGSLNWSADALKQDNSLLIIQSPVLARHEFGRFDAHFAWSRTNEPQYQLPTA
jgi:phosphatidylserine/phosphatidylglycerophosphate/cardiolipin synthase-like enzyme